MRTGAQPSPRRSFWNLSSEDTINSPIGRLSPILRFLVVDVGLYASIQPPVGNSRSVTAAQTDDAGTLERPVLVVQKLRVRTRTQELNGAIGCYLRQRRRVGFEMSVCALTGSQRWSHSFQAFRSISQLSCCPSPVACYLKLCAASVIVGPVICELIKFVVLKTLER